MERVNVQLRWPEDAGSRAMVVNQVLLAPGASNGEESDGLYYLLLGHAAPPLFTDSTLEQLRSGTVELPLEVRAEVVVTRLHLLELRRQIDHYLDRDEPPASGPVFV